MSSIKLIGIAGVARCGKDSLYKALYVLNHSFIRHSFADKVKEDVRPVISRMYNIDILNCSPEEKEKCREIMVNYANIRREEDASHWIKEIEPKVLSSISSNLIPVLTDVRYENEVKWIQSLGGKVFHLTKFSGAGEDKTIHPPANSVEARHDPLARTASDFQIEWEDNLSQPDMITFAKNILKNYEI